MNSTPPQKTDLWARLPINDQAEPFTPPRWAQKFIAWRERTIPEKAFMFFMAVIVGILAGIAAWFFKFILGVVGGLFTRHVVDGPVNWWLVFVPVAGILATCLFTHFVIRTNLTHGCGQLIDNLKQKVYRLRHNMVVSPIIGGTITLGLGGTSGSEGPIAVTGAAIGSNLGQFLGLSPKYLKILLACGASAAIAGIFMSPVGGLMFSLELLGVELATVPVMAVTLSCLMAFAIVFIIRGFIFDHTYTPAVAFDYTHLWALLALGVFCGIYCLYYTSVCNSMDARFRKIRNPWVSALVGGVSIGVCLLLFPAMYGTGYGIIGKLIHGDYTALQYGSVLSGIGDSSWPLMLCGASILLLKCWGVTATNSSGGVGGDFSPTLFAGAICGYLFATFCNTVFGTELPVGVYAFLGMAGVMSAAIEAPLMTIFIVMDLGQSYTYAAPIGAVAIISYLTMKGGYKLIGIEQKHRMVCHVRYIKH